MGKYDQSDLIITATILEIAGRAEYQIPIPETKPKIKLKQPKRKSQLSAVYQFRSSDPVQNLPTTASTTTPETTSVESLEREQRQAKKAKYFSKAKLAKLDESEFKKGIYAQLPSIFRAKFDDYLYYDDEPSRADSSESVFLENDVQKRHSK